MKLSLEKYKLIIFDWDGTLVDTMASYQFWDQLYVQRFYGVDLPVSYFEELARKLKEITPGVLESRYFRYLDETYGDGKTPPKKIWENIYSLAPEIQGQVSYRDDATKVLKLLRSATSSPIALGTNAEFRDIKFYSSQDSRTAGQLSPIDFFDLIITSDDVTRPKPDPETFQLIMRRYNVDPREVLIFEDSFNGVMAGRLSGADVATVFADPDTIKRANISFGSWGEVVSILEQGVS